MSARESKVETLPLPLAEEVQIYEIEGTDAPVAHEPDGSITTIRERTYKGRKIEVHTSYKILIDSQPLPGHVAVFEDGSVHYHGLPQYSFSSALDMVRQVIDSLEVELPHDELADLAKAEQINTTGE